VGFHIWVPPGAAHDDLVVFGGLVIFYHLGIIIGLAAINRCYMIERWIRDQTISRRILEGEPQTLIACWNILVELLCPQVIRVEPR
jgi:hypothetical protein